MAGTNPDFDAAAFRDAIGFVHTMALPDDTAERPTFHFPATVSSTEPLDADGVPFTAGGTTTQTAPDPVRVPCGVEYFDNSGQPAQGFGIIQPTRVVITVLDEFYPQVEGCSHVVIDGDTYFYRRTEPPSGLFDVTLYTMHFAVDSED